MRLPSAAACGRHTRNSAGWRERLSSRGQRPVARSAAWPSRGPCRTERHGRDDGLRLLLVQIPERPSDAASYRLTRSSRMSLRMHSVSVLASSRLMFSGRCRRISTASSPRTPRYGRTCSMMASGTRRWRSCASLHWPRSTPPPQVVTPDLPSGFPRRQRAHSRWSEAFELLDESPVDCDQTSPHNEKVGLTEADLLFITHRFIRDGLAEPSPARPGIDLPRTACIAEPGQALTCRA
jgi:hypothetical protein